MSPLFHPVETRKKHVLDINDVVVKNPNSTYFIKVEGTQFNEYGISHNDILVVDKSRIDHKHEYYVISAENEFTLLPYHFHPKEDCEYWGAVTHIIKKT